LRRLTVLLALPILLVSCGGEEAPDLSSVRAGQSSLRVSSALAGEGEVAVTGIMFWSRHTAGPVEQVAIFEEDGARISEVVLVPYVGNNIWSSSTLDVPVRINLGQTYSFGFAPVDALSARIAYDDLSDCSSYSPSEGSKYNGASDHILDTSVPGGDVDSGRYGFFGIKYSR